MVDINDLLSRHRKLSFPDHSGDEVLDDLLLELAEYDGHVVGIASSAATASKPPAQSIADNGLLNRIIARVEAVQIPRAHQACIVAYVDSLKKLRSALICATR